MTVTIHQPEHLVWLGLLHKIAASDIFVILDTVQFEKNYFQNRNKIRTAQGAQWVTVPVKRQPLRTEIKDIEIATTLVWKEKYLRSIEQAYKKAPFFEPHFSALLTIIKRNHLKIVDLNCELLDYLLGAFGIQPTRIVRASELAYEQKEGEQVVFSICKALQPDTYLSGPSGHDYLLLEPFQQQGIEVRFHEFVHPTYTQLYTPFLPYITAFELLFLAGPEARTILFDR